MIPQHSSPRRLDVATTSRRTSFWLTALLGLPALNVVVLLVAGSGLVVPVAAVLALLELVLLIALSRDWGIGVLGALGAMLGNVAMTLLVLILALLVAFMASCNGGCLS